jgi:hypothetical protein
MWFGSGAAGATILLGWPVIRGSSGRLSRSGVLLVITSGLLLFDCFFNLTLPSKIDQWECAGGSSTISVDEK